jgi:sarcosine oxidase subunit alpha
MPETVTLVVNGVSVTMPAAAWFRSNSQNRRNTISTLGTGEPRGPLCGMGICFECRVTIDGEPHCRSCQTFAENGMDVRTDGNHVAMCWWLALASGTGGCYRAAQSGLRVIVVDDNPAAGGQIWRGEQAKPHRRGAAWFEKIRSVDIQSSTARACFRQPRAGHCSRKRPKALRVELHELVLATGARERFLPFPVGRCRT